MAALVSQLKINARNDSAVIVRGQGTHLSLNICASLLTSVLVSSKDVSTANALSTNATSAPTSSTVALRIGYFEVLDCARSKTSLTGGQQTFVAKEDDPVAKCAGLGEPEIDLHLARLKQGLALPNDDRVNVDSVFVDQVMSHED